MESMELKPRRIIRLPLKKIIGILLVGVVLVALFNYFDRRNGYGFRGVDMMESVQSLPSTSVAPDMQWREYGQSDIGDTREFLKINYSSTILTRDVSDTVKDVKGAIREYRGRIDYENTGEKHGQISFVIPKSTFESFRTEIESIAHEKLYTESVSSHNLLGEKQGIEKQMNLATSSLAELETQKESLDTQHAQSLNAIQYQLTNIRNQVTSIRASAQDMDAGDELTSLKNTEDTLLNQIMVLQQSLARENANYYTKNKSLVQYINQAKGVIESIETQGSEFIDNVETVTGYVTVSWISIWELAEVFSPVHPTLVIVVLLFAVWFYLNRKGHTPKFEFV